MASTKRPEITSDEVHRALWQRSSHKAYNDFSAFTGRLDGLDYDKWPPICRMFDVVMNFDIDVDVFDVGRFLESEPYGVYAHEAVPFLRKIGAPGPATFLAAALRYLPRGRVPRDFFRSFDVMEKIRAKQPDPFEALTKKHRRVMRTLVKPLVAFLRAHEAEILLELGVGQVAIAQSREPDAFARALNTKTSSRALATGASPESGALQAVATWVRRSDWSRGFAGLTRGERLFWDVYVSLCGEIANGGVEQFLSNSSGDNAEEVRGYLAEIGARRAGAALKRAASVFPRARIPSSATKRDAVLRREDDALIATFDAADAAFETGLAELYARLLAWLRKNQAEFVSPARPPSKPRKH